MVSNAVNSYLRWCSAVAFSLLLAVSALAGDQRTDSSAPKPTAAADTATLLLLGADTFTDNCAKCHQPDGFGKRGLYPSLHDPARLEDSAHLVETVLHGRSAPTGEQGSPGQALMPALEYLTDREITAVIAYITSNWGSEAIIVSEAEVRAARGAD